MSFDDVQFPLRVRYGARGGPQFATEIVTIQGGFERRNQRWAQARRRYDARTGVTSAADAALLLEFFHARAGRARGFRLKDWSDFSSARDGKSAPDFRDQIIGTGDGATKTFQLIKTYGNSSFTHERVLRKPVAGSVVVGVAGARWETGWSVDLATGILTFAQAPSGGAAISAGFYFDVPVRFDTDRLNLTSEDSHLAEAEIPLIEVRV